jgi:hypothetical protein
VLPPDLLNAEPSDAERLARLAAVAGRALGVVTRSDLAEAAAWVGCDNVELGQVEPPSLEPRLRKAISGRT